MAKTGHWQRRGLLMVVLALGLAGCAATFVNHGYAPTDDELKNVVVGVDTRSSVETTIGRPVSTGVRTDRAWYYVSSRVRQFTYNADKVVDRQLVAISFNKRGVVSNVERFTLKDGRVIALNRRITSSGIKGVSFIGQMLGNIGRVNLGDQLK